METKADLDENKCKMWKRKRWFEIYCVGRKQDATVNGHFGVNNNGDALTLKEACGTTCGRMINRLMRFSLT